MAKKKKQVNRYRRKYGESATPSNVSIARSLCCSATVYQARIYRVTEMDDSPTVYVCTACGRETLIKLM